MTIRSPRMRLGAYNSGAFDRGAPRWKEGVWIVLQWLLIRSWIPGSWHRCWVLRLFGARIGERVVFKPGVRVKFPWRLVIGDDVWLGEDVWIDNLAEVRIGNNVCISQGSYLCTGSHDWREEAFTLLTKPIVVESESWIGAQARVAPGVQVGAGAVLALGSVATRDLGPGWVHQGNPAMPMRPRHGSG
jgi:putative colanic acid biosynthesis acetyltransferase WcaF